HAGLGEATIVPLLLDLPPEIPANGRGADPIVISVGRVVPSKRLEDVIKAFALYQRHRAPAASLAIVGSDSGFENYRLALARLVARIGANRVFFTGRISAEARDAWYRRAHVYLSMSVHEGFCAPLVEALAHGVPVVARGAGAVPETLQGAGLVLDGDDLLCTSSSRRRRRGARSPTPRRSGLPSSGRLPSRRRSERRSRPSWGSREGGSRRPALRSRRVGRRGDARPPGRRAPCTRDRAHSPDDVRARLPHLGGLLRARRG
ncbi:MAG: glycosyltransferase, partial [Actinobacteria bacterium]